MLGKTIYYLDFKNKKVETAVVIDEHITSTGYGAYMARTSDKVLHQVEMAICYKTQEEAEQELVKKQPLVDEMNELRKSTDNKLNEMRDTLIGKPDMKHLIEE